MNDRLQPVDRLEILFIVDNVTDSLSSNPAAVRSEWAGLWARGRLRPLSGDHTCCAHHGLSILLTVQRGPSRHHLLFDAGPEGDIFLRNARILGVDPADIDSIVLSHGHWDHAGGLVAAIEFIARARAQAPTCYVHPDMFVERGMQRPDGAVLRFAPVPQPATLERAGAQVLSSREPQLLAEGMVYLSGEVPRRTPYETGFPGHVRERDDGQGWEPDPLILDERYLSVHVQGKGQIVFSACSHAGIVNVLLHAREVWPELPLHGVVGGLHLSGSTEAVIAPTLADLHRLDLQLVAPGHCTGWRALSAMAAALGQSLVPSAVGKHYVIASS